jgi:hypothetical protein
MFKQLHVLKVVVLSDVEFAHLEQVSSVLLMWQHAFLNHSGVRYTKKPGRLSTNS